MGNCAGVDWASEKHDVHVADEVGEELLAATFAHDEAGLGALCRALVRMKVKRVAIERPDGVLIERLLDAGLTVIAIHPNQAAAARPRFRASGRKSDRFDAFVHCELARTDHHRFRGARARQRRHQGAACVDPRARGSRAHQGSADPPVALGARALLARADQPVHASHEPDLAGVHRALPKPDRRARTRRAALRGVPQAPPLPGRQDTLAAAREAQRRRRGPRRRSRAERAADDRARARHRAGSIIAQIKELETQISQAVRAHPDGEIFLSFFRCPESVICAATLLSEIGDCRARYPTADALAADAGQAAVAIESGKRKIGAFRWRCDHRLRFAFATLSDSTRHWHPWAADHYARARDRGHDHRRAIRTVGRAWSRVLWRCWQDHTPYDPARHGGLQRHITVTIPTPSGPRPDLAATQRMAGAAVTDTAARRAERAALDGKPPTAGLRYARQASVMLAKVASRFTTSGHGRAPIELAAGLLEVCGQSKRLLLNSVPSIAATARLVRRPRGTWRV